MKNPNTIGRIIGCIAFAAFAIPFTVDQLVKLGHDVPDGYKYLAKGKNGSYYYLQKGEKYEDVQVVNMHVINKNKETESFVWSVDCAKREISRKKPGWNTIGSDAVTRACR